MDSIQQPSAIAMPFAENGVKNNLPTNPTGTNLASLTEGFPQITSEAIDEGGIPPARADMNALGNIATWFYYFMQCGGSYTFRQDVSDAIGGYPLNALLWYNPANDVPNIVRSTIANNTNNFVSDPTLIGDSGSGKPWEIVTVSGENFVTKATAQTITGAKTFSGDVNVPTIALSSNDNKAVNSAFIAGKFQVVNALPENPDVNTFYFIKA